MMHSLSTLKQYPKITSFDSFTSIGRLAIIRPINDISPSISQIMPFRVLRSAPISFKIKIVFPISESFGLSRASASIASGVPIFNVFAFRIIFSNGLLTNSGKADSLIASCRKTNDSVVKYALYSRKSILNKPGRSAEAPACSTFHE